jgi:hypothetical protein
MSECVRHACTLVCVCGITRMYVTVCERIFDMFRGLQLETIQDSRECLHANLRFCVEFLVELRNHVS